MGIKSTLVTLNKNVYSHKKYFNVIESIYQNIDLALGNIKQGAIRDVIKPYNIFGIRVHPRSANDVAGIDEWNDVLGIWDTIRDTIYLGQGTTDPGTGPVFEERKNQYLRNDKAKRGMDHLEEGFHHDLWKVGHMYLTKKKVKSPALRQVSPISVWLDMNYNNYFDAGDVRAHAVPNWGINMHSTIYDQANVGNWSAGCQVWRYKNDFDTIFDLIKDHAGHFSYYLMPRNQTNEQIYKLVFPTSIASTMNSLVNFANTLNRDIDNLINQIDHFTKW